MSKKQFKAESKRLLDLMINSIYTNKEIFLREIISNASDAIDKLCYLSLTDEGVGLDRGDFRIDVIPDKEARTITVRDNGIGMSLEEAEKNLGVIARSGSGAFKAEMDQAQAEDLSIIGQFGVGFYSAFMVSDKVTVLTRKYGEEKGVKWESTGADGYTVTEIDRDAVGTDVVMHIKPDTDDEIFGSYLEVWKLKALIKKYSDYVRWPIKMEIEHSERFETGEKNDDGSPKFDYRMVKEEETGRRLHRLVQGEAPRRQGPLRARAHQRRGRGQLQGHALRPRRGERQPVLRRDQGRHHALLQRRDDHGEV